MDSIALIIMAVSMFCQNHAANIKLFQDQVYSPFSVGSVERCRVHLYQCMDLDNKHPTEEVARRCFASLNKRSKGEP